MIRKEFVDREEEINFLKKRYKNKGFEFIIITGRRRTGKSRLLEEFVKGKKNIFLQCEDRRWQFNLLKFNEEISKFFRIPNPNFKTFTECFEFIGKNIGERIIVVIDEFSYLIKKSDIVAEFQTIVDKILQDKNLMLILSGSSVSMMHKNILNKKSPLYGRITGHIMLQPLQFIHVKQWFKDANIEDISKIYAVCGGVPRYLEFFEGKDAEKEIREHVLYKKQLLWDIQRSAK